MKIIALFLLVVMSFGACKSGDTETESVPVKDSVTKEEHSKEEAGTAISLNNGAKWNADSSTNNNVADLQIIAANFKKTGKQDLTAFHSLGNDLQSGLDKLISECRMKGPDHEALHHWLEPVLKETGELKTAASKESAERIFHSINTRLSDYKNYFE